jgi:hypothetical protein
MPTFQGMPGPTGPTGPTGIAGPGGPQGAGMGPTGPSFYANGIVNFSNVSGNTITVGDADLYKIFVFNVSSNVTINLTKPNNSSAGGWWRFTNINSGGVSSWTSSTSGSGSPSTSDPGSLTLPKPSMSAGNIVTIVYTIDPTSSIQYYMMF